MSIFARFFSNFGFGGTPPITPPTQPNNTVFKFDFLSAVKNGGGKGVDIDGGPGDETLTGTIFDDKITGGGGNDSIVGLDGKDKLEGDAGNDTILGGAGKDDIEGGTGNDSIEGGDGDDKIDGDEGDDIIFGDAGKDDIDGDEGNDEIHGGDGDDKIDGDEGNDIISGDAGEDDIDGDDGEDYIDGGADDDKIDGGDDKDTIFGGSGEDDIKGGQGDDEIHGGDDDDKIKGDEGHDLIFGDGGDDDINAGAHDDIVFGGEGNDKIDGKAGTDTAAYEGSILDFLFDSSADSGDKIDVTDTNTADGDEGTDEVKHVEFLQFNDFTYELGANNAPLVVGDDETTDEDTATTFTVNAYDFEGDALAAPVINYTGPGTITLVSTTALSPLVGGGTSYTYSFDPDGAFDSLGLGDSSDEVITVSITDAAGNTTSEDIVVTVTGLNDPPVAVDDTATTDEDTSENINVLGNDTDPNGDDLTVTGATALNGEVVIEANGTLTYTPDPDYNGPDTIGYDISDGNGGTDSAEVAVTVDPVNDDPVAVDDTPTTDEDTEVIIPVLANDTDVDGDTLEIDNATQPPNGTVFDNGDGTLTYTPDPDFNGDDSFTYTVDDGNGGFDTATVTVTVDPVNDDPVGNDDSGTGDEDTAILGNVLTNDTDVDGDTLEVSGNTAPTNGSVVVNTDGSYEYTPDADFNGADSFTYTVSDGNGGSDEATVNLTVDPVNDDPVANDDTPTTDEDTEVIIPVLANDTDVDGDTLEIDSITQPVNGTVANNGDGTLTYTPDTDFNGNDSFTYTIDDGNGGFDTATVTVTVDPVNDDPVANDDTATTDEDVATNITVLGNDTDVDLDDLTVTGATALNGSVVVETDGTLTYTPDPDYNGPDTISYDISDGNGGTDSAEVAVTVNPVNDAPVSLDIPLTFNEADGPILIDLSTQVQDPDGDLLRFSDIALTAGSTVIPFSILTGGQISIDPTAIAGLNTGDILNATFSYTVTDNSGAANDSDTGVVPVTINGLDDPLPPGNTAPTANPLTVTADEEDGTITIPLSSLIFDPDEGDVLTITSLRSDFYFGTAFPSGVNVPFSGGITLGEGGVLTFDPVDFGLEEGETETITLTYIVEDAAGLEATNTITLNLTGDTPGTPTNLPPTAGNIPSGPFSEVQDVIVDDSENPTFTIDLSGLVNDPDGPNGDLVITPGDFVIGSTTEIDPETGEETVVLITAPYSFDSETGIVTITLADIGVADGEEITGALNYTVTDVGGATASGQVVYNYVNPEDDTGGSTLIDFEEFSAVDPEFTLEISGVAGFTFQGLGTVIETDELENEGSGREPGGILGGQTTPGGDNVLVGAQSTLTVLEPVLDEGGEPVLDERGQPLFEEVEVLDENFAILAPGQTVDPGAQVLFTTLPSGISFPVPDPLPNGFGTSFDLEGLSLNLTSETTATVTITTYAFEIVEEPIDGTSSSEYFYSLEEVDSFDFVIDGSTGATEIDFNASDFGIGLTGANDDPTEFEDILAVVITTDDGTPVVLDDILVTL